MRVTQNLPNHLIPEYSVLAVHDIGPFGMAMCGSHERIMCMSANWFWNQQKLLFFFFFVLPNQMTFSPATLHT